MNDLLVGLVGALLATNQPVAISNLVHQTTGVTVTVGDPNDPVEKALKKLSDDEDKAQLDVQKIIVEDEARGTNRLSRRELFARIDERYGVVSKEYDELVKAHPDNVRIRLAYANYLEDTHNEDDEQDQLEKALTLCTNEPSIYNNLANIYGHHGPVKKAFEYYAKAIELNPREPVYYENFGTTVYLFRVDAKEYYGITEPQVFEKAFELYSNAMRLDPDNFALALDVARSYYEIRPMPTDAALHAFTNALQVAHNEREREDVYLNFARIEVMGKRFDHAREHLSAVTNDYFGELKRRVLRTLNEKEAEAKGTNAVTAPKS